MSTKNVVSIKIPSEKLTQLIEQANNLNAELAEYLIALSPQERRKLAKVNDKTMPFVEKAYEYTKSNPEFIPPFMDAKEMETDFKAMNDLKQILNPVANLYNNLNDTIMLSGSEAYQAGLTYYNSAQQASKMNIPNAKGIADDLGKRFVKESKKTEKTS